MGEKKNDKLQETISEAVLQAAFAEAAEQEIAELEAMDIEVPSPTEKQRKEIEKAIRDTSRKQKRGSSRVWRAVAIFAIFFSVAASVIMIQPTVRASVWDFVVSFYEKYLSFDFDAKEANANYIFGEYAVTYVPDEFVWDDASTNPMKATMIFKKGKETISIAVYSADVSTMSVDIEQGTTESVKIRNYDGYIVDYRDSDQKELVWGDDTHTFIIRSSLSKKEMLKIAENIK